MDFLWSGVFVLNDFFRTFVSSLVELAIKVTEKGDLAADNRLTLPSLQPTVHLMDMKLKYFDKGKMINDLLSF